MEGNITVLMKILISIFLLLIIGLITFFYNKNFAPQEVKTIEQEIDIKQKIGEGLLDLRTTLKSDKPDSEKIKESLLIIDKIKLLIDGEYDSLRKEAQEGADRIVERLDKIAEVIPVNIVEAIKLVDSLIDDLEDSDNIGTFGNKKEDSTNNIIFNDNYKANENEDNVIELEQDTTYTETESSTTTQDNDQIQNDPDSPFQYIKYKKGVKPKVDRDLSTQIEGQTIPIGTKIGN